MATGLAPKFSIVIPVRDERESIPALIAAIREASRDWPSPWEAVVVDDGSSDGSFALARDLTKGDPAFVVARLKRPMGQTAAMWAGFRLAKGELIATIDADLQCHPRDIALLLEKLDGLDAVFGVRSRRMDSAVRRLSSGVANAVRRRILQDGAEDTNCPLKLMRRSCLREVPPVSGMHRFLPALLRTRGLTVGYVPVPHHPRASGASKYGVWNRLWKGAADLLWVFWLRRHWLDIERELEAGPR